MKIKPIEDGNSNFELVELRDFGNTGRKTPHCKNHGAMLKVSEYGFWRCIMAKPLEPDKLTDEYEGDCRAGCQEYHGICPKCNGKNLEKESTGIRDIDYCYFCKDCKDNIARGALI